MTWASVVLPRPGGPQSRATCGTEGRSALEGFLLRGDNAAPQLVAAQGPTATSPPVHLVFGSVVLVQLGLQHLLGELDLGFPLVGMFLGMAGWGMSCRAGLGLLASLVLAEHHRVPQLEPLQQAAVGVLQESRENPWNPGKIQLRAEESSPSWSRLLRVPVGISLGQGGKVSLPSSAPIPQGKPG